MMSSKGSGFFAGIFHSNISTDDLPFKLKAETDVTDEKTSHCDYISNTLYIEYFDGHYRMWYKHDGSNIRKSSIIFDFLRIAISILSEDKTAGIYVEVLDFFSYYYGEGSEDIERDDNLPSDMDLYFQMHPLDPEASIIKTEAFCEIYLKLLEEFSNHADE